MPAIRKECKFQYIRIPVKLRTLLDHLPERKFDHPWLLETVAGVLSRTRHFSLQGWPCAREIHVLGDRRQAGRPRNEGHLRASGSFVQRIQSLCFQDSERFQM